MRTAAMRRIACALALIALATMAAGAQAFTVRGQPLTTAERSALSGGETYVYVDSERTVARVATIPRDSYGMDYSRASCYSVEVRNAVMNELQDGPGDKYHPQPFPIGTVDMEVSASVWARNQIRYGTNRGEWITTNASTTVTAYPRDAKGDADLSKPFTRQDSGYFWHTNNARRFEEAKTAGCLLSSKYDLERVIATLKADSGRKRLTVK